MVLFYNSDWNNLILIIIQLLTTDCPPLPLSDSSPKRYPVAELSSADGSATCFTTGLLWDLSVIPALYLPTSESELSATSAPLDLSSPCSLSSSASSSGEEDEGRSSDPPSPEPVHTYAPRQRMKCTGVMAHISPPEEEERETRVTAARPAFLCKHCPKEYTSLGALKMHIRSHTLPCVCTTCGKAFSRPWLLRGHIRTHTGKMLKLKSPHFCSSQHLWLQLLWVSRSFPHHWSMTINLMNSTPNQQTLSHKEALCRLSTHWSLIVFNVPATMTAWLIILSWLLKNGDRGGTKAAKNAWTLAAITELLEPAATC